MFTNFFKTALLAILFLTISLSFTGCASSDSSGKYNPWDPTTPAGAAWGSSQYNPNGWHPSRPNQNHTWRGNN
tara:strand:+ start:463 stop:681 length:219 start_codon:yes stop_codon:yes gene_type:complete